jgi:molybdopterin molybdotransferase
MAQDWIDVREAWDCIEQQVAVTGVEPCLLEHALHRVMAAPVQADRDFPPFDRSAMDGFAVRAADIAAATSTAPTVLRVIGEVTPGQECLAVATAGTTVRIMTGAAVPAGWDTVVPVELTSGFATDPVEIHQALPSGRNIAPRGRERHQDDTVYASGHRLTTADIGGLAMLGCNEVTVTRQPSVSILATGNELVGRLQTPGPLQIRNSNTPMLEALLQGYCSSQEVLGVASDTPAALRDSLQAGLRSDVLFLTGGVSAGAYDFVESSLEELGVHIQFRKVAVQPGKPVTFGVHEKGYVLALPGNPVSAWTTFRLFGMPLLLRMQGARVIRPQFESCLADFSWQRRNPKWLLFPGVRQDARVTRASYSGSGDLLAFAAADGQIVLPPEVASVAPGDRIDFWPLS